MEFFQKRKWNINIQKYMLLDFLCFKKGILGWGKPSSEKVLNSKQISPPPLEKILATPQLMSVIVSFTISQNWNFVFFLYIPKTFKDNSEWRRLLFGNYLFLFRYFSQDLKILTELTPSREALPLNH